MDFRKLADMAKAELEPLSAGLDLRATLLAAETAELGPGMLGALLAHELVAGHAAMMKLTAKLDRWLALMSDDRLPADQDRGARESVRLAVAAARLTDRYRLGLQSLAKLKGWEGAAAKRRRKPAADPFADLEDDDPPDGPDGDPPGGPGGTRQLLKALKDLQALNRAYGSALDNGHANGAAQPNGTSAPNGPPTPPPAAQANRACPPKRPSAHRRGTLRHGNPSGDFLAAPRCGAKTRAGCTCRQPAMANGRCRMHGGCSTGARTAEGLARCRTARLVHGCRTAEIIDLKSAAARHGRALRTLTRAANAMAKAQSERSTPCQAKIAPLAAAPAPAQTDLVARLGPAISADAHPLVVTPAKAGAHKHRHHDDETPPRQSFKRTVSYLSGQVAADVHANAALSVFMGPGFRRGDNWEEAWVGESGPRPVHSLTFAPTGIRFERPTPCQASRRRA